MFEIIQFACSSFWKFCGTAFLLYGLAFFGVNGIVRVFSRFFRMVMVCFKGWPPSHLDADGDFMQPNDKDL